MKKKEFIYQALFLVAIILLFLIPVSVFFTSEVVGRDTSEGLVRLTYSFFKDQGSLVAGLIALAAAMMTIKAQISLRERNRFEDKKESLAREILKIKTIISNLDILYSSFSQYSQIEFEARFRELNDSFEASLYEIKLTSTPAFLEKIDEIGDYLVLLDILSKAQRISFYNYIDFNGFFDFIRFQKFDKNYSSLFGLIKLLASEADAKSAIKINLKDAKNHDRSYKSIIFIQLTGLVFNLQDKVLTKLLKM